MEAVTPETVTRKKVTASGRQNGIFPRTAISRDNDFQGQRRTNPIPPSPCLFRVTGHPRTIPLGGAGTVNLEFLTNARLEVHVPYGHGLRVLVIPGKEVEAGPLSIQLAADRPHAVNLGSPWMLRVVAENGGFSQAEHIPIEVPDVGPGRVFYILTEDCETFDGGPLTGNYGTSAAIGNHNNFMDPEDYLVQMVAKPDRMNGIAEKHGAQWTHFWCAPQRFAAEWATLQSSSGKWKEVCEALDASIRKGSVHHEYAPHLHCDYEPGSRLPPQPRLVYDPATDGILPNEYYDPVTNPTHKYHDWDGAARGGPGIKSLGSWNDVDSKTGSLFKSLNYVSQQQFGVRRTLCARTGSFDFGADGPSQEISTQAFDACGLLANSDARFKIDDPLPDGNIFWCRRDDRFQRVARLEDAALVQLAVTRYQNFDSLDDVNGWFQKHFPTCRGPGVHAMVLMSHAMFMHGLPDPFRSLEGGSFEVLDRHLAWVKENYPRVEFATATDAVIEFLDYYTPRLLGLTEPIPIAQNPDLGLFLFSVRLLGRHIYVGPENPARIQLTAPAAFHPRDVTEVLAQHDGQVLGRAAGHRVEIVLDRRHDPITLQVRVAPSR